MPIHPQATQKIRLSCINNSQRTGYPGLGLVTCRKTLKDVQYTFAYIVHVPVYATVISVLESSGGVSKPSWNVCCTEYILQCHLTHSHFVQRFLDLCCDTNVKHDMTKGVDTTEPQ